MTIISRRRVAGIPFPAPCRGPRRGDPAGRRPSCSRTWRRARCTGPRGPGRSSRPPRRSPRRRYRRIRNPCPGTRPPLPTNCCTCCTTAGTTGQAGSPPRCTSGKTWLRCWPGYRIEPAASPDLAERSFRHSGGTMVGDGRRCWHVFGDEWRAVPGGPPAEVAKLLDASGLLEHRLSGGAETTVDGRRGYRIRVTPDGPVPAEMFFADDVVADTELGILLRLIYHAGSKPVSRWELRDVVVGGDIHIDIPEETLAADDDDLTNPARIAAQFARYTARDVRSALRNIFGGR